MTSTKQLITALLMAALIFSGCSSDQSSVTSDASLRTVSAAQGYEIQSEGPDDLIVLDVRTPGEFEEGHLDGAVMVDFYDADFTDQLAELDRDAPYLLYCRSGNRSGQTIEAMRELGFSDVANVEGGIVAWAAAGLPIVGN